MMEPHTKVDLTNGDRYAQNHSTCFILLFNFIDLIFFPEAFYASVQESPILYGAPHTKVGLKKLIHVAPIK